MKETNHDLIATHEIIRVLETSLYFSRNIIDNQPDIIIITDQNGRIYRLNQHGMNFFERSKTEILGRTIDELCQGRVKRTFIDILKKEPFENASFSNEDMSDEIKIYWQITRMVDSHIKIPLFLIKGTDTTELHRAYKKMEAINSEKQKIEDEIKKAKIIQETLLPDSTLPPAIKLESIFVPAAETSGDWFGYHYDEPDDIFNVYVGDVTGHGLSSALLTGVVYGAIYSTEQLFHDQEKLFASYTQSQRLMLLASAANSMILKADARLSMTMFFISIEISTGKTCFLNAGHRLPFLYQAKQGQLSRIKGGGDILGFSPDPRFDVYEFDMQPGDTIVLYTDGLLENKDRKGQVIKEKVVRQMIVDRKGDIHQLKTDCLELMKQSWEGTEVEDDVAMLFISYKA
ncbi:SpoIIE family protein phosphatase [Oligoflexus tunisiensis]|uniref:SpoIIE family protein phosphatase n=1 Tax=Oligoflexus tunisiensis TaxID=708132 RepID=UPI000A857E2F|nr:SpoIIE family protein phosphatase [Oligoflexus tunisiensis]